MATLRGARELKARLKAVGLTWKPVARRWADETVNEMRPHIPVRTGKTRRSVKRGRITAKRAKVVASYVTNFLDAGTKAHDIKPRRASVLAWDRGGRTVFARRVHKAQTRGTHFKGRAAREGLERTDVLGELVKLWNEAA